MAVTHIAFGVLGFKRFDVHLPMMDGESVVSEGFTPSGSNQQSAAAPSGKPYVRVSTDTAVYLAFGESPDATVTTGRVYLPANGVEYFQIESGNKVAVVAA